MATAVPEFATALHPEVRALDSVEADLMRMTPWAACQSIEAKWRGGKLGRDDALVLLEMHADRLARDLAMIKVQIMGLR